MAIKFKSVKNFFSLAIVMCVLATVAIAQQYNCSFKDAIIKFDFGNNLVRKEVNLSTLKSYQKNNGSCPDDGTYIFSSFTKNCFNNNWHTLLEDHTPNDEKGLMLIVNAAVKPGIFFINYISGLKPSTTYELSCWMVNICRNADGCTPTPPNVRIAVLTDGKEISGFTTGQILPSVQPVWKRFFTSFTTSNNAAVIMIKMEDITRGGCGNDFALDDIVIKECILDKPVVAEMPKPVINPEVTAKPASIPPKKGVEEKPPAAKPAVQKTVSRETAVAIPEIKPASVPEKKPIIVEPKPVVTKAPATNNTSVISQQKKEAPVTIPVPKPIATRANPVIKTIETEETEMIISLYDNGEIDGDTVSIYHNNRLVVNQAALSEKPVSIKIKVDKQYPHHELVMVANNLGSIPPNTSLMVVTASNKRYEIFISSSEQKNAKILIDLKE